MYIKKILFLCFGIVLFIGGSNLYVILSTKNQFHLNIQDADCILVLGAGIKNNKPTPMLKDRLDTAIALYQSQNAPKIIMSGDHSREDYNEVDVMKSYAIEQGVPSSDIFMDHEGYSTYESLYRAQNVFQAKKVIIVTQDYHLYRALFIANALNLEAVGVSSNPRDYSGQTMRDIREVIARTKDVLTCLFHVSPDSHNEVYPVSGDGDTTNNITPL